MFKQAGESCLLAKLHTNSVIHGGILVRRVVQQAVRKPTALAKCLKRKFGFSEKA